MIQLLGGLGAGLAIVLVVAGWRLSSGPISLAFLSSYVETALNEGHEGFRISLDDTILTWAGWERTLDIRVINVQAFGADGHKIGGVPELSLSLSARALIRGLVAPQRIELFNPSLKLVRHPDGRLRLGFGDVKDASEDVFSLMFAELMAAPDPGRAMSYLSSFDIIDAEITFFDHRLGAAWKAPRARASLNRDSDGGIKADMALIIEAAGQTTQVSVLGGYLPDGDRMDFGVGFSAIKPAAFSALAPELKHLAAADLPVEGTVTLSMTSGGVVEAIGFDLTGGAGHLALPVAAAQKLGFLSLAQRVAVSGMAARGRVEGDFTEIRIDEFSVDLAADQKLYLPRPLNHEMPIKRVSAKGGVDWAKGRFELSRLDLDLGGPTASITGSVSGLTGGSADGPENISLDVKAEGHNVPTDALDRYWPKSLGADARRWVLGHLSGGSVPRVSMVLKAGPDEKGGWRVTELNGDMDIENVAVDYLAPMPKAEKVSGIATFDRKRFDIALTGGGALKLKITRGTVSITGLDEYDQYADIQLTIDGPVQDAMRLVESKPLGFASAINIDPERTGGEASTKLKLRFIVENALTRDQIKVSTTSAMSDVSIAGILGQGISRGQLVLQADNRGMNVAGQVSLGITPATLAWRRNFGDKVPFRGSYDVNLFLSDVREIREMGVDLNPFPVDSLAGSLGAEFRYTEYDGKPSRLQATADLTAMAMNFTALGWRKEAGVGGTAELEVILKDNIVTDIPRFSIYAGDMALAGRAKYAKDGTGLAKVDLKEISYGKTDMAGALIPADDGSWTVSFHGASFDLEPVFEDLLKDEPVGGDDSGEGISRLRFSMSVDVDRIWLGKDRSLDRVVGTFARAGNQWRSMAVDGRTGKSKPFSMKITPGKKGNRQLDIKAADAGTFIRALGFYDNMVGGSLSVTGAFDDQQPDSPLKGKLLVENYRVIEAPALAHLVSIMALTGILEAIQGDGLAFTSLDVPFSLTEGVLEIDNAKATGLSLGYTAKGTLYTHAQVVDLTGTVVPAYAINTVLGNIPLLGEILTGGEEGGGVFAATYAMTGPMEELKISMNPLSVLAPGILRNLFGYLTPDAATSELRLDRVPSGLLETEN